MGNFNDLDIETWDKYNEQEGKMTWNGCKINDKLDLSTDIRGTHIGDIGYAEERNWLIKDICDIKLSGST